MSDKYHSFMRKQERPHGPALLKKLPLLEDSGKGSFMMYE
jgi:hypothetical protein